MSEKCQLRTHAPQQNRSLFDQLVSELLELQRHLEAQRLGGLEIDDQLKLCRRLQWKVGRLLTLEDAVDVPCRQAKLFVASLTKRDQAARLRKEAIEIDRRHAVAGRQRNDQFTIYIVVYVRHRDEAATWIARLCGDNAFDLILGVNRSGTYLDGKGGCGSLNGGHEGLERHGCCWIDQQRHTHGALRSALIV